MAGEDEIDERREALLAEGARLGEDFGLGACTGAWMARRHHQVWGCGTTLLAFHR